MDSALSPVSAVDDPGFAALLRAAARAPALPMPARLRAGERLGDFELGRVLGEGGMGVVHEARDQVLERDVAVKVLREATTPYDVFAREARATARLNHANIVTLYQVGRARGLPYLVLERLHGETLARRLARGPLARREALALVAQLLDALVYAHARGIVHRDLKPGNLFVTDGGTLKVLDFGLAGLSSAPLGAASSGTTTLLEAGTPAYMAPEQWRGERCDARADVYAVGVILFELLAGRRPHDGEPRPDARPSLGEPRLDAVLARALAFAREARWPSAEALRDALAAATRPRRDRRWLASLGALAGCCALATSTPASSPALPALGGHYISTSPERWEQARLAPVLPGLYYWRADNDDGATPLAEIYRNHGFLRIARRADGFRLEGQLVDQPGVCCGNVGVMEIDVTPRGLRVARSLWGPGHEDYIASVLPYDMSQVEAGATRVK